MNNYLFVIDKDGNRITSLLDGLHGNGEKELIERAKKEFPNAQYVYSDEDMQQEFYAGKVFVDGRMQDAPIIEPTLSEIKKAKIAEIKAKYEVKFAAYESVVARARLANNEATITKLQVAYKSDITAMAEEIKEA